MSGIMTIICPYPPEYLQSINFRHIEVKEDELRAAPFGVPVLCIFKGCPLFLLDIYSNR
jgi:hypothetical protein